MPDLGDPPGLPQPVILIVPVRNEAGAIGAALAAVPRGLVSKIIVADGQSTDSTAAEARGAGAEVIDAGRGYGRACARAAQRAAENSILVFMDGDGSDRADLIGRLVTPLLDDAEDFVIASRARGQREPGSMGLHQLLMGRFMGLLIRIRYGVRYTDMCAFRAIRRKDLLALGMQEMGYGWNLEMQMRAAKSGLRIREIPVPYRRRVAGASKVAGNLLGTIRAGTRLFVTFCHVAFERG